MNPKVGALKRSVKLNNSGKTDKEKAKTNY